MATEKRKRPEMKISEKAFQAAVIQLAKLTGWMVYHTFDSRRSAPGFPDLVLVRDRVLFRELKSETGRLSAAQKEWLRGLTVAGMDVAVWRPSDWTKIKTTLAVLIEKGES